MKFSFGFRHFLQLASFGLQKFYDLKNKLGFNHSVFKRVVVFSNIEIGNFIVNLPVLESVCAKSQETLIIAPSYMREFSPDKASVITIPNGLGDKLRLLFKIIFFNPDHLILFEANSLGVASSIPLIFSSDRIDFDSIFLKEMWFNGKIKPVHLTEYNLNAIIQFGFNSVNPVPEVKVGREDFLKAEKILASFGVKGRFFVLFPGSSDEKTRWRVENFAKTGDSLARKFSWTPVIVQGPDDAASASLVAGLMKFKPVILPLIPLNILAGVFKKAGFYIGMDTGPAHLAAAVGCPTVSVFTRGCPYWYYPYTWKGAAVYVKAYVSENSRRVNSEALRGAPASFDVITPSCVVKAVARAVSGRKKAGRVPFNGFECNSKQ